MTTPPVPTDGLIVARGTRGGFGNRRAIDGATSHRRESPV